jgi:hypothetical protein
VSRIRLILDTSAVRAFAAESIDVGEPVAEIEDDRTVRFGVPLLCLIEATQMLSEETETRPVLLVERESCVLTSIQESDWRRMVVAYRDLGRLDLATATLLAADTGAPILTGEPDAYGKNIPIIPIG